MTRYPDSSACLKTSTATWRASCWWDTRSSVAAVAPNLAGLVPAQPRGPRPQCPNPLPRSNIGWVVGIVVAAIAVVVVAFVTGLVELANLSQVTTGVIVAASVVYFVVILTSSKVVPIERTRLRAFIPLFIANAFWSLFQQIFTVLAVYSDERMNWSIFGRIAPSS